jgi:hypothetical protein
VVEVDGTNVGRSRRAAVAAALLVVVGVLVWGGPSASSAVVTTTLAPTADAYVDANKPSTRYGTDLQLVSDHSPIRESYLRFDLRGITGPIQQARLRIHVADVTDAGSPNAGAVARIVDNGWTEAAVTYSNRPTGWGADIAALGRVTRNTWVTVDVTTAVAAGSTVTVGIRTPDSNGAYFDSRQATATAPQLVVTSGSPDATTTTAPTTTTSAATTTTTTVPSTTAVPATTSTTSTTSTTVPGGGGPVTVLPVADTFVDASKPTTPYGTTARATVDASPVREMYLRFDLTAIAGPIRQARLQLHVADVSDAQSPSGGDVASITDTGWSESTVTYASRPTGWGATVATIGKVTRNSWIEVPVTAAVTSGAVVTVGLRSTNGDGATYDARELAATAPRLVLLAGTVPTGLDAVDAACQGYLLASNGPTVSDGAIREGSGIEVGLANPGMYWIHNDSGDIARIFAVDATGATRRTYVLGGATATDIEDIDAGPGPVPGVPYLYVADIGDNSERRTNAAIYRVPEPTVTAGATVTLTGVDTLWISYPDGPHNAESLVVDPQTGDMVVIAKPAAGGPAAVYRAPANLADGSHTVLVRVGTLPLPPGSTNVTTAADVSPDGSELVVRTYAAVLLWHRAPGTSIADALATAPCQGPVPPESQGEAAAFHSDGRGYVTMSEGAGPVLHQYDAP